MIIRAVHNTPFFTDFYKIVSLVLFLLFLLFSFALSQTAAVGPVLGVNYQLHLELSSQHELCSGLPFLLNGFDLCLQNKILISLNIVKQ